MQQIKSPYIRGFIHFLLVLWTLYSIIPFVMSIITSLYTPRDTISRDLRFFPQALVDNNGLIALIVIGIMMVIFIFMVRGHARETAKLPGWLTYVTFAGVVAVVVGLFIQFTNTIDDDNLLGVTWSNYEELWLSIPAGEFAPVAFGIFVFILVLITIGYNAKRFPRYQTYIYLGIVLTILGAIFALPSIVQFAEFYDFFLNSILITAGTVSVSITIGCFAGYALARYRGVTGFLILFAALGFRALPRMAFILPYYYFAQISGLFDTHFLLIITFVAINQPFTIWMLRSFFMEIPRELEEAAMIDGCSRWTAFVRVIIPVVWPGIITTALFSLLLAYNEFLMANILTATILTLPVGISPYTSGEGLRLIALANASAVSITLPIIIIIIFFQRYLIQGLVGGAVKG